MATERTPLQSPTAGSSARDEYGIGYVDEEDDPALDASDDDEDDDGGRERSASTRSDFFRQSDHELLLSAEQVRRQHAVAYTAYALLALLVLFFVWSSLQSPPAAAPVVVVPPVPAADANGFFCGLRNYETGYVTLANKQDDRYFYWYVESTSEEPEKDPLVLWLTGGPGVASTVALLTENGPCLVQPDLSTTINEYAWTNVANVIWLDQPTNVGFSYGSQKDPDSTETSVGENIFWFLQGFFDKHPELQDRAFFIAGESYAGHYVPAAAHYIMEQAKSNAVTRRINLRGITIGNGLVDAAIQFPRYIAMAENAYNVSFVNTSQLAVMQHIAAPECERRIRACQANATQCIDAQAFCESNLDLPFTNGSQRDPFDIRKPCAAADAQTCNSMDHIAKYLNLPQVRARLLKTKENDERAGKWELLNEEVQTAFSESGDVTASYSPYVAGLLDDGIRVLVYAGDADLACNWYGNRVWTQALDWEGTVGFNAAEEQRFVTESGTNAGVFQSFANRLTFVRVFNAGHMVPHDQPEVALDMVTKFLKNATL